MREHTTQLNATKENVMDIKTASCVVLVVAIGAVATVGTAATRDREAAQRHCMRVARMGMPIAARPSLAIKRRQTIAFNECMEREGHGHGHAEK